MNRSRIVLAALVGVLAVCIIYAYQATPRLEKAPPRKAEPRAVVKGGSVQAGGDAAYRIDFAYTETEPQEFTAAKRDIFNFLVKRAARPKVVKKPEPVEKAPEVVMPLPIQPAPVDAVNRSLSQFTFMGFLEKAGEKTVFLSSSGSLFLVKGGERFGVDREFLVREIEGDFLRIQHRDREGIIELKLIDQQKLNAAVSAPARLAPREDVSPPPRTRFITPPQRALPQGTPGGSSSPEMNQENNPEAELELEEPVEGDGIEGEINGTNQ